MTEREVAIGNGTKEIQLENSAVPQKEAESFDHQYQTKRRIPMPSIREFIYGCAIPVRYSRGSVSNFNQSEARKLCFFASDWLTVETLARK